MSTVVVRDGSTRVTVEVGYDFGIEVDGVGVQPFSIARVVSEGHHRCVIVDAEWRFSKSQRDLVRLTLEVIEGPCRGMQLYDHLMFLSKEQKTMPPYTRDKITDLELQDAMRRVPFERLPAVFIGVDAIATVKHHRVPSIPHTLVEVWRYSK